MPELPEVESARATIEAAALHREIADVDDTDTWECRPHAPGEIRSALVGRELTAAHRRGKTMWCDTSARADTSGAQGLSSGPDAAEPGPVLGIHLGMSGRILVTDPDGRLTEGGDWLGGRYGRGGEEPDRKPVWDRFTITFADGGSLRLFDKRRLGRVRLDPDLGSLGPDAQEVTRAELTERLARSSAALKARLLDQSVIAGVGNLLADETLWEAKLSPERPADELSTREVGRLYKALEHATADAIAQGGVHTGEMIPFRHAGARCPRCGTEMTRATIGGRTTWWCPKEQR